MLSTFSRQKRSIPRLMLAVALPLAMLACGLSTGRAKAGDVEQGGEPTARDWAQAAAANEEHIILDADAAPLRYQIRKLDAKGDTTRVIIESREGNVARLIARNGAELAAAEDGAERERLQDVLNSPAAFLRHARRDRATRPYATQLVHLMPEAMLWSFAPGPSQTASSGASQVVLDFLPNPNFKPPTMVADALTGVAGRVWIDKGSRCVTRIQGRVLRPVDFGWGGMLARVNSGGTIALEQTKANDRRWVYSHLEEHLSIREALVHTVEENTVMSLSDVHPLPSLVSFQQAIHSLLGLQISVR